MTQTPTKHDPYLSAFRAFKDEQANSTPAWLDEVREAAISSFAEAGFPTARRGNEQWKYTNVAPIAEASFQHLSNGSHGDVTESDLRGGAPWSPDWTNLVFIDGRYHEGLSNTHPADNGVQVVSLASGIRSDDGVVQSHLARYATVEQDAFTALNTAFVDDGALVHISDGAALDTPIHLVFASTDRGEPGVSYPRILVVAGRDSRATIVESYVSAGGARYLTNAVAEMRIGEGAQVEHYRILLESEEAFHIGKARVYQSEGSRFSSGTFEKGPALGRYDLYVELDGPESSCVLNGLYLTRGDQHMDNLVNIDHLKPRCTSRLYYKGILDGSSRAVFGGTVWVREDAQKTDAMQSDKNLVLSPDAEVDSKPALFIYADDVKCGHGATAGNVDRDTVFYMRSRGLDLETASGLLIYGFASEVIDTVRVPELRRYLEETFLTSLPTHKFEF